MKARLRIGSAAPGIGRRTVVTFQDEAGYLTVGLLEFPGVSSEFQVGQEVEVTVTDVPAERPEPEAKPDRSAHAFGYHFAKCYEPGSETAFASVQWLAKTAAEMRDADWVRALADRPVPSPPLEPKP